MNRDPRANGPSTNQGPQTPAGPLIQEPITPGAPIRGAPPGFPVPTRNASVAFTTALAHARSILVSAGIDHIRQRISPSGTLGGEQEPIDIPVFPNLDLGGELRGTMDPTDPGPSTSNHDEDHLEKQLEVDEEEGQLSPEQAKRQRQKGKQAINTHNPRDIMFFKAAFVSFVDNFNTHMSTSHDALPHTENMMQIVQNWSSELWSSADIIGNAYEHLCMQGDPSSEDAKLVVLVNHMITTRIQTMLKHMLPPPPARMALQANAQNTIEQEGESQPRVSGRQAAGGQEMSGIQTIGTGRTSQGTNRPMSSLRSQEYVLYDCNNAPPDQPEFLRMIPGHRHRSVVSGIKKTERQVTPLGDQ